MEANYNWTETTKLGQQQVHRPGGGGLTEGGGLTGREGWGLDMADDQLNFQTGLLTNELTWQRTNLSMVCKEQFFASILQLGQQIFTNLDT